MTGDFHVTSSKDTRDYALSRLLGFAVDGAGSKRVIGAKDERYG
jgi:hypothetical protein